MYASKQEGIWTFPSKRKKGKPQQTIPCSTFSEIELDAEEIIFT